MVGDKDGMEVPSIGLSWLTVKVRVRVAKLHTDQTVGSSVMNARVVTVSGVTWTSFTSSTLWVWVLGRGGIAIDWVTQRWRFF